MDDLYDALKNDGAVSGSRENFNSKMLAPGKEGYQNRLRLFNALKADGAISSKTYEEFAANLGLHAVSKPKANVGNNDTQVRMFAPAITEQTAKPQQRSQQKQQQSKASKPTAAQNAAMADWAGQAMMDVARGVQRTNKVLDYQSRKAKSPLNVSRVRVGGQKSQTQLLQNNNVVEGDQKINPDSGEFEQTYLTSDGGEYTNRYTADMAQNQLDAVDHMIYLEEHPEEYLLQEKSRIENEMRARAQELEKEEESNGHILRDLVQGSRPTVYTNNRRYSDQKYTSLMAQMKQVDEALETLRAAKEGKKSDEWIKKVGDYAEQKWGKYNPLTWAAKIGANVNSFLEGSWRGFVRNVGKVGTWDMGFTDALSAGSLFTSAIDNEKGKAQKEQKDLLNVAALSNKVKQENEQYLGRGYKAGEVTATSLPFMIEMMLNPASGMGQAAQRTAMRYCIKRFGAAAVREATKNYIKKFAFKYGARLTGDAVGSAVMAATTGQVHVVADQLRRMTGDIQYTIDSQGNVVYGGRTNAEDNPFKAYAKAFGAQAIENHSEMLGEYFAPVLGKAGSLLNKGLTKATSKNLYARFGVQKIRNFIAEASHSNIGSFITNLEKRAKWNGTIGEYAEEVAGNIENAILVGDNTLDTDENTGVFNLDQNIDTFLGVSLMGGFISTVKTGQYIFTGAKREAYNQMNDVGRRIDNALTGNFYMMQLWGEYRNKLLIGTDEEKKQVLHSVTNDKKISWSMRQAVFDYAKAVQKYKGICAAQATKRNGKNQTVGDRVGQSVDDASEEGYQASNEEKNAIRRDYRSKRSRLFRVFEDEARSVDRMTDQELSDFYSDLSNKEGFQKEKKALLDYMRSRSRYYGMIERAQDDIDDAIDESNRAIDSHANQNGMIQKATLNADGRQVFIVSGNVSLTEDGKTIDTNKSDQSLVIVDAQTGKREMIAPSALQSVDEPIDAAKLKQDEEARIRGEKSQQEADVIDGKLAFNVGDEYGILDYNGKTSRVKVLEDKGETVLVDMDGRQVEVTKKQVQQMYDDFMQSQSDAETEQAANENGLPPYGFSDEFDFTDKEGNVIHGEIQGINEDGVEIRTDVPYNGQIVQVIPKDDFENMITNLYREGNEVWNKSRKTNNAPTWGVGSNLEINGHEYNVVSIDENGGTVSLQDENGNSIAWTSNDVNKAISDGRASVIEEKNEESKTLTDNQGNPINEDGTLKVEEVKSVDELTDEDFSNPTRNVQLPTLPQNVDAALNAKGKPVIIKKNIFEKNWNAHKFPFEESRTILNAALYNTDLVGQTQPSNKPLHWVAIKIDDKSPIVVLEVNEGKENVEIVGWYTLDERNLNRIKRQAAKNGGELVMLSPKDKVESLSTPQTDLSSESKVTEQSSILQTEDQENVSMPMRTVGKGKNVREEEDWLATSPERGHDYIFSESGLDAETANTFVENKLSEAKKNLDKVKKNEPKIGTSIAEYKAAKQEHDARVAEAQKEVDYWNDVKAVHAKRAFEAENLATEDSAALAVDSAHQVDERISQKWNDANKIDGDADEITLPNGESVKGHYVLTESGAASASHQATNGFAETEGFPVDENGQSVNDRDYKRDHEAQEVTRSMASDYDSRALQSPVVVSRDGVVLSGNGRTMAGEIAAQNGTDKKYNDYLRTHANKYGFTEEQVNGFEHPRLLFVPDADMPYTAETFAKFNQREQKSQNKTEQAVKMGKVVDDALFGRVMQTIGTYDTLGEFYGDDAATHGVVKELAAAGVIPQTEMAQLFDGGKLSEAGQAMVEGVLIGKVFQANPDAVREITEVKSMRQSVMAALQEIVTNSRLGGGYDLSQELAEAIDLVYKARKAGYKAGMRVSEYAGQGNLFQLEDGATVADYTNAAVMMLADVLNDGRTTQLKKVMAFYNRQAADAAQGIGDMFAGGVKTKEDIINEVNEALNNGQNYNRNASSASDGQGGGNEGGEQGDVASPGDQGGERGLREEGSTPLSSKIEAASAEVNTSPTEAQKEAGNYKKGHVQVGTFDITIEQPEGSVRKGTDANGKQWESKMNNTYGYIRGAVGVDGDHIDVFLSNDIDGWNGRNVFVVDQYTPDGSFDEHKVMLGFNDADEAKSDYLANYEKGWEDGRRIDVTAVNLEDFEKWIASSKRKTKPFAEYAGVKKETVSNAPAKEEDAAPTDNDNISEEEIENAAFTLGIHGESQTLMRLELDNTPERARQILDAAKKRNAATAATSSNDNAAYTITPSTYTNKKGKTSDVSLLIFDHDLTADQERAVKEFAKEKLSEGRFAKSRGWKDRESGGWMFRSEEDARKAAEMVGNEEAVADNQPLTAQELRDAVDPKKPTTTKKPATKKPANRVELADVAEQKPSEPTKAEQPKQDGEKKLVITGEMKHDEDILRKLLGIGDEELDGGIKFRDPDAMTSQQRRFVYNAGVNYSLGYIDQGFVAFPEFAKAMVSRLGYKIKPWLKSFYEGVKRIPGYDQAMFTPTEEVDAFDVENFDKPTKDVMAQANMIVEEGKAQVAAEKANNELKATRNEQRKETEKQTAANTDAIGSKATSVASEVENLEETSSDRQELGGASERVDEALDKVNEQLALLGYYEAEEVEKDYNEAYGYMRNAEKKAVQDAANLASQLIDDLGLDRFDATHSQKTDKKGNRKKKPLAVANIAPIGGDVYIRLPLAEGRELYLTIGVEPRAAKGVEGFGGSDLEVTHIMFRVENPESTGNDRYGRNEYVDNDVTYSELLDKVQREVYKYIPERTEVADGKYATGDKVQYSTDGGRTWIDAVVVQPNDEGGIRIDTGLAPVMWVNAHPDQLRHKPSEVAETKNEDIFQKAERIAKEAREKNAAKATTEPTATPASAEQPKQATKKKTSKKKVKPEQTVGNLFAGLFDETEENGLQRNDDAVRSQGVPADSSGQQQGLRGSEKGPRKGTKQEGGRSDGGRGGQSAGEYRPVSAGLHGLTEPKNTRNNHSERGADHAPTSVNGRIEANIKAIELAHELLESGETATPEQMSVLRQFSGWGGLGAAFSDGGYDWKQRERNKKIRELLGEEAYEQAVMSANSAYYTPAYVVDTLWDIAGQLGFKGGNILEGSAGIGNILGQMPTMVSERSNIHAIEIDGTSGGILSLLYPDAKVDIQGFEQTRIPNGSVDLAITNVPFVTGLRVNDTTGDSDLSKKFHNIHDFCIAKNVRKLREGGLGIFISSNGTLDNSKALRDWVVNEGGSDFIGAFRMNNKTFGGTTVTSDIIVIRKRVNGQKSAQAIDVSSISGERTAEYEEPGARKAKQLSMDYNKYFIEHPDHMAGEMRFAFEEGDTFRPTSKGLYPVSGKDQGKMLADFVKSFTEEDNSQMTATDHHDVSLVLDASADGKKLGEMYMKDGQIVLASFGGYYPLEVNDKKIKGHTKQECFTAYAAIKSALAEVMQYQTENESDAGLKPLIAKLNKAYDTFVNTYGHFNKNNQLAWLRNDVDYPNVFSLETYKEQGDGKGGVVKTYDKADVMKGRVVEKESEPHPENVKDGVVVSMFKNGRIDVPYIASQLGKNEAEVKREIIDSGLGFEDPTTRQMEVSYQYLSGNVREKLKQAEINNENGEYSKNIKALQDVVPMNIPAHLIDFTLGSSWLDPKLYDVYVKERTDIDVHFTAAGGTWFMKAPTYGVNVEKNRAMGVVSEMLKKTIMGHELIEAAIQNKSIIVSRTEKHYDGTTETITDREATSACAAKIDEIRQDFKDWARQKMQSDAALSARIETEYNDRFNNYVPMSIPNDFVPEYFGGATHKFKMRPHQGKAIVRGTMQPLLLAHEVGTGKTFTLISIAMEMRRLGTARKPMIVVQNATVGQFAASAKELYPNAKILTLEDNDRNAEGRKNFYAKIKYNDWDMIVVPQSTFEFIPDSDERKMQFVQDKIDEKMLVLEKMREADTSGRDPITRRAEKELADLQAEMAALSEDISKKRTANNEKKKAVAKQNAAVKAQEMLDRRTDDVENFDDMGIDALLIDEAHEYKHLGFATAMQRGVKGVDPSYSKKSQGVYLKTQAILEKNNGRNVIFATGTPISNTAAEIWTFMRYLMPKDTMKEYGIYYFDDFVRNFGNIQQMPEFGTSGKFKEVNRFAGYVNLPELVRIWSGVADTVLTKDQTELVEKIPEMEGGKAQDIYLPQTRALRSVMKYVREELERFDKMSGKEKKENSSIPLTMYGIAQGAAVDARLVEMHAEDDPRSKTNEAVRQTLRSLKETDDYKGTVAIFADHYQNKRSGFNLYEDIKKKLIQQGVPESEVIVMKPGMTIKKKLEIFDKVNRGEVRVILGSTATLGTGVNIQERLHTLIHLDAPNRPMDYTQRNGRILRQGNLHKQWNKPVRVLRFGVEDSLDVTAYQRLKTKGAIADSVMEGDRLMQDSMNNRVLEEEEDVFGDTVAQLSGSEYALLKNNAEKNVRKYESRKKQWEADQTYIHNAKPKLEGQIKAAEQRAEEANTHLLAVQKAFPDGKFTEITVGKLKFASVDAMADFIKGHNKKILDAVKAMKETPGNNVQTNALTLSLGGYDFVVKTEMSRETVNNGGLLFAEIHRRMSYSCPELGLKNVPVKQSLLRNAVEDITENVITGRDFAERFDIATRMVQHGKSELEQLKQREGKPFEFSKELEEAKRQFEEYSEAMKVEMAEKEKKYAEMDSSVEAASDVVTDDEDEADDGNSKHRMLEDDTPNVMKNDSNAMVDRVTELSERLHTPVRIIRTEEEMAALPSARQRRMKGSFNPMTGEVTIVVPNNSNMADIENTFVHEVVGHDGLRVLFPDEAKLNNALDELYRVSKDEIRGTIDRMAQKMYDAEVDRLREKKRKEHKAKGEDPSASYYADMAEAHAEASKKREQFKRDATEEYGADLAGRIGENGFERMSAEEQTFWGRLKSMLQKALQKLLEGLKIASKRKWGDKDWAFVLHEAYKRKKNGGRPSVFDQADTVVMREKTGFGETKFSDDEASRRSENNIETINANFNEELQQQIDGKLPDGHIYKMGNPGRILLSTGVPNLPIQMNAKRLQAKATSYGHDFDLSEVKDLVKALQQPLAIFAYGDKSKAQNIIVPLQKDGNNFIVGLSLNPMVGGRKLEINSIRNVFPKNNSEWLNWISQGKALYMDKEKIQTLIDQQRTILADVDYLDLDSIAKVVENFENPTTSDEINADNDLMFRDGDDVEYDKAMARDIYEKRVSRGLFQTQEAIQDSMLGLKEAMDAILKAEGNGKTYIEDVAGYENSYLGENRLSSVNQAECTAFAQTLFKPMLEEVAKLAKTADERAELTDYMMAKHGLERNEVMARRAAEKDARSEFFAEVLAAQQAVDNDPLDQDAIDAFEDVKQRMQDREEELYLINRERDYAGLTALTGMDNVLDAETEAQQMVSDYERDHWVDGLWDKVNAVTKATLQKTYESGLINKATYDDISGMYENYIPLRGFDDKTSDEAYAYLTDKHSAFNAPIKTAKGRKSKADDPFANMEAMAESAIMQGNRNTLVKQKFLNFALNHPSDLVSVSDLWLWHNDVADEWQPINSGDLQGTERIEEDDSPAEVERKMRDFEYAMQQAAKNDPAHFRKQKDNPAIPYRVVESRDLRQHQVLVKRNGRDIILTINGNPRAAQALNGQTNPDNDVSGAIGAIMRLGETVNRQLSAFYTTRNPDFVVSNFVRDMMYANTMVWVKESPNYAWRFHKNVAKVNPAKMKVLLAKLRNGTLDLNDETEKMFHLYMMNGGETGYANIRDIEQRKNDIKRELKKSNGQMPIRKAWYLLGERLDEYNRAVENCARFAAFMTSRQLGRTIDRSVYDAKEISVNFNKKGSGAKFWKTNGQTGIGNVAAFTSGLGRSFYVFWNAAIQGSTNFGRQFKRHPKKAIAGAAAMFLLGALMASIGGGDGDDDKDDKNDYFNLPEYVRRSNVVFRLPGMDKSWISMPLPVEYRAMYGMGELMVSAMSGKEHYTAGELAHQMASQVSQMLPIDIMEGGGGFKAFVPSAIKPIAEVIGNESWTGMPIYKDTPFNKDMPEWTKAYKSANKYLVGLSKALNEATGGDAYTSGKIDINPAQVEYLLNGIFGGVSSTIDRLTKMGETIIGDREYEPRSFLLLNRLVKNGDERTEYRAVNNEYFRIKEESEKLRTRLNHYENDTANGVFDYAEKIAWLNNSPEYRILETYEDYSGDIDDINEELKAATSDEERKGLEAELNQKKKELVDMVHSIRKRGN